MADQLTSQIGIGLLDISALTAIIGSATAESLMLGNRGAAGLPWATMSIFGLVSVIKACFGAIVPCSFRESLGVRNRAVDLAVGMYFDLDSKYKGLEQRVKEDLGEAIGIVCLRKQDTNTEGGLQKKYNEVYAFDQFTLNQMRTVRMSNIGEDVEEYIFYNDQRRKGPNIKLDWIYLFGSLVKLIETFVLWKLGAAILWFSSSLPWLYFFVCAVILQQRELSRGYRKKLDKGELDILAGELPTILKGGGKRQILLGAPQNFRHNKPWKIVWMFGTVVCTSSLILTYAVLGRQDTTVVYVWLSLQVVWLILRSAYFQTAEGTDTSHLPFGKGKNSEEVPSQPVLKERVLDLMFALAKYRANIHPRGSRWYHEDPSSSTKLREIFSMEGNSSQSRLPIGDDLGTGATLQIKVIAVIGDCLLGAAAWLQGMKLSGIEYSEEDGIHLFDSCVVTLQFNGQVISLPGVRALCTPSNPSQETSHAETGTAIQRNYVPRGAPGEFPVIMFYYWIPCSDGRWLNSRSNVTQMLGVREATITTDAEIQALLDSKILNIDKWSVKEMRRSVKSSETCGMALFQLMK